MIATDVFDKARDYAARFANAQPFRHVEIDGFLRATDCERILAAFPAFEDRNAVNEMGVIGNKAVRTDVSNLDNVFTELDSAVRSQAFLDLVSEITGIPELLYDPDYIGGGTHENRHGQALAPHVDFNILPGRGWHRRLNLIVYLNPEWQDDWGGCIELHSNPWKPKEDRIERFLPLFNRCVIFETNEYSWHGFETIRLPADRRHQTRKSYAIYLYTRDRPGSETVPSHGTVYVPRGMPKGLHAGSVISEAERADIESRFEQLLGQIRFLYDRELEYSRHHDQLGVALADAHARIRIDVQGFVTQNHGVATGIWPDGWFGIHASTRFTPTQDADALEFAAWVPESMPSAQVLDIRVGGLITQLRIEPGQVAETTIQLPMRAGEPVQLQVDASVALVSADGSDERALGWRLAKARLLHPVPSGMDAT